MKSKCFQQGSRNRAQIPVDWTPAGLFVQGIIWASDAPPQNLALLQPDGTQQILRQESYLRAVPSREGERVAIVTGQIPIGGPAARMAISVLDVSTGNEQVIFPETPIWISDIAWSPDGSQLAFISAPNPHGACRHTPYHQRRRIR
ncbi:MAG: hypothetical protein KatS3mg057_0878 [Herpetosiphonaceae bacterium]|nr:MAG: hypothetical protein KatS3mg057_0878 [Herpetosiphonaceae bacterium]